MPMNSYRKGKMRNRFYNLAPVAVVLALAITAGCPGKAEGAPNVVLWDTLSPLTKPVDSKPGTEWKVVPTDLLSLETDPPKASSDPGYYGRSYAFKGDAV